MSEDRKEDRCGWPRLLTKVPRRALVYQGNLLQFRFMLKRTELRQQELEPVSIKALMPEKLEML
jgi:hypothetical protein